MEIISKRNLIRYDHEHYLPRLFSFLSKVCDFLLGTHITPYKYYKTYYKRFKRNQANAVRCYESYLYYTQSGKVLRADQLNFQ